MITEQLKILTSNENVRFCIGNIEKSDEYLFEVSIEFEYFSKIRFIKTTGLSEFSALMNAINFIGNTLRGLEKDLNIEFDFEGLTMDEYIPLPLKQRKIWDE